MFGTINLVLASFVWGVVASSGPHDRRGHLSIQEPRIVHVSEHKPMMRAEAPPGQAQSTLSSDAESRGSGLQPAMASAENTEEEAPTTTEDLNQILTAQDSEQQVRQRHNEDANRKHTKLKGSSEKERHSPLLPWLSKITEMVGGANDDHDAKTTASKASPHDPRKESHSAVLGGSFGSEMTDMVAGTESHHGSKAPVKKAPPHSSSIGEYPVGKAAYATGIGMGMGFILMVALGVVLIVIRCFYHMPSLFGFKTKAVPKMVPKAQPKKAFAKRVPAPPPPLPRASINAIAKQPFAGRR